MRKLRAFFFGFGCFQCFAIGQSVTLREWTDAVDSLFGAVFMFGAFFFAPAIARAAGSGDTPNEEGT